MEKKFYIYCLFRPWNLEPCYIGKGSGDRWRAHNRASTSHHNIHLARIYRKAQTELPVVIMHDGLDEATAFEYERALIAAIGRIKNGGPLVNQTDGGEGPTGHEFSKEHCAKISQSKKGIRTVSLEGIERMRKKLTGRKQSEATIKKRADSLRGRKQDPEIVAARAAAMKGRKRSAEAIANIRAGRRLPPEADARLREKISLAKAGKKPSEQALKAQRAGIKAYWDRVRNGMANDRQFVLPLRQEDQNQF